MSYYFLIVTYRRDKEKMEILKRNKNTLEKLSRICEIVITEELVENCIQTNISDIFIYLPVSGFVDIKKEIELKVNKLDKVLIELKRFEVRLENSDFVKNAPENLIIETKERINELLEKKNYMERRINELSEISNES